MSSLYNLEPQPTASCILHTTGGDISLELWAQQVPLTCRNFLQHSLDGYYNGTIFHRLIPGFILQGGDPTGSGSGGESIYDGGVYNESREEHGIWPEEERKGKNAGAHGVGFKDEFHSRLKFNRRGLLGMANEGPDTNGSQFFLTLAATPELQGKNTLFGRVVGDTIYNVAKMGEAEVEEDRPLYPIKITEVEILVNPFKEMVITPRVALPSSTTSFKPRRKEKKRKGGKQLLSFDADDGDVEELKPVSKRTKFDARIVADEVETVSEVAPAMPARKSQKVIRKAVSVEASPEPQPIPVDAKQKSDVHAAVRQPSESPEPQIEKVTSLLDRTNAQIAELKASMKRNIEAPAVKERKKSALEQMIPETSTRGRKRRPGGTTTAVVDQQSLDILKAFKSKLESAPPQTNRPADNVASEKGAEVAVTKDNDGNQEEAALCDLHFITDCQSCKSWDTHGEGADPEDADDLGWMSHALSFKADKLGKDLSYRKKAEDELMVIDPRKKSRTLKEEKRAQKEAKSGGSGRAWDEQRNQKLARAANLAGRGAR